MLVWRIDPLPDFLADHTLPSDSHAERLREVVSRWVQWVGNLWSWHDRASFAIRYLARQGSVEIFLLAQAHDQAEEPMLAGEVAVLLRAHRLAAGELLSPLEFQAAARLWQLPQAAILEVRQHQTPSLWTLRSSVVNSEQFRQQFQWLPAQEMSHPRVIYPWWAPGGPYLVPMESLISQPVPVTLTIYLEPTELKTHEWLWLATMASEAQSKGEQSLHQLGAGAAMRVVDPSANLAGRLYIANLRRLTTNPFLVNVHCAAADGRLDVASSLAGAIQSLVQEPPFDRLKQDDDRLPSAADVVRNQQDPASRFHWQSILQQHHHLRFPQAHRDDPLLRLPYLADSRGAATVFRLPVSMRGGVPGIRVRQLAPDFHPGPRQTARPPGHLDLGAYEAGGRAYFPVNDLCKHALITGFTGSGKTVTVLQLLHQLWAEHGVPFLVLESAKQEYRGLLGVAEFADKLQVYTLGNELCVPFRINPFELLPGVRVEAHLSKLQTCIEGAIPPIGPSASIISEALLRVYEEQGWSLTDVYPESGESKRRFPVFSDFARVIKQVLADRQYVGEVQSNLEAALVGRFKPLLMGGKGRMFDTQRSQPPPSELFSTPVILEMNDLSVDDKALVVMFLLSMLREYRERHRGHDGQLVHVTMVEEAHNVLESVSSKGSGEGATSADTRFKAVEAFCQLLTEIRALGEGLIIADQSPEKLARDALRNTNLQIAHQLRDGHDREAIANAMIMEKEQRDFLGKLRPGQAAVFRTGLEKATFLQVDKYYPSQDDLRAAGAPSLADYHSNLKSRFRGVGFDSSLTDDELRHRMTARMPLLEGIRSLSLPYGGCRFCQSKCHYRDEVFIASASPGSQQIADGWLEEFELDNQATPQQFWTKAGIALRKVAGAENLPEIPDAGWCLFVHWWSMRYGPNPQGALELDQDLYSSCVAAYVNVVEES